MSARRGAADAGPAAVGIAYLAVESIVTFVVLGLAFGGAPRVTQRQDLCVLCTDCRECLG